MYKKSDKTCYEKSDKLNKKIGQTSGQVIGQAIKWDMGHKTSKIGHWTSDIRHPTFGQEI